MTADEDLSSCYSSHSNKIGIVTLSCTIHYVQFSSLSEFPPNLQSTLVNLVTKMLLDARGLGYVG